MVSKRSKREDEYIEDVCYWLRGRIQKQILDAIDRMDVLDVPSSHGLAGVMAVLLIITSELASHSSGKPEDVGRHVTELVGQMRELKQKKAQAE